MLLPVYVIKQYSVASLSDLSVLKGKFRFLVFDITCLMILLTQWQVVYIVHILISVQIHYQDIQSLS